MKMSDYANTPAAPTRPIRPEVGGWLLYFCIAFTILAPFSLANNLQKSSDASMIAVYITLAITSFIAGLATWSRAQAAFPLIRLHLAVRLLYGFLQIYIAFRLIQNPGSTPSTAEQESLAAAFNIMVPVALFLYFRISSRVHETFGRNI
jgi:hypothetical protein